MLHIYVATSWRTPSQPDVVRRLKREGHEVYDFRHPTIGGNGFHWSDIDPAWQSWSPEEYRSALSHPIAIAGFNSDMDFLRECDAVVAVQPFGRSASLELGWACGDGKITCMLLAPDQEPELMAAMCARICLSLDEVVDYLAP